ncbi:hypothetical protein [Bartonella heixiaziensis]
MFEECVAIGNGELAGRISLWKSGVWGPWLLEDRLRMSRDRGF